MDKDFPGWCHLKVQLHTQHHAPTFQEREIWWCCIGVNVGHEADGKNEYYNRPVLVLRKFNKRLLWGLPLSTKIKDTPHYHRIHFNGKQQSIMLTHLRLYDSQRLTDKMGKLSGKQFEDVQAATIRQLLKQ